MKNLPLLLTTLGGTLIFVLGVAFLFGRQTPATEVDASSVLQGARHIFTDEVDVQEAASEGELLATEEAIQVEEVEKVTVVEFSDFQCPACKAAYPLKAQLFATFPGQVEFVYRHFPLSSIHPNALLAAQASEVASSFGKFWEMHDLLFEKQEEWSGLSNSEAEQKFVEYAIELEIDEQGFSEQLNSDTVKADVQQDIDTADQLKLNSTPTFFVNGKKVTASEVISTVELEITN